MSLTWKISCILLLVFGSVTRASEAERAEFFETRIRPVLLKHCFGCHGGETTNAELRLDNLDSLLKGGDSGPAIIIGNAADSLLLKAVSHQDADLQMPPDEKLPAEIIEDLSTWIQQGAVWPKHEKSDFASEYDQHRHWAFQPVRTVEPPIDETGWAEKEIDLFVSRQHQTQNLTPAEPAKRAILLRRLYYDLHGLPPTVEETDQYLNDNVTSSVYAPWRAP